MKNKFQTIVLALAAGTLIGWITLLSKESSGKRSQDLPPLVHQEAVVSKSGRAEPDAEPEMPTDPQASKVQMAVRGFGRAADIPPAAPAPQQIPASSSGSGVSTTAPRSVPAEVDGPLDVPVPIPVERLFVREPVPALRQVSPRARELSANPVLVPWLEEDLSERRISEEMLHALAREYRKDRAAMVHWSALVEQTRVEAAEARARENGLPVEGELEDGRPFVLMAFTEGFPQYSLPVNVDAAVSSAASFVRRNADFDPVYGLDVDGGGFFAIVNDHGIVRQHDEFQLPGGGTRLIEREQPDADSHADHVAGTVGAHGYNPEIQGMSPAVLIYSHNQQSETDVYSLGMEYPFQPGKAIMGTTSLGSEQDNEGDGGRYWGGSFDTATDATPYYLHFYAAGNYRSWNTISNGRQVCKNIITVASARDLPRNPDGTPDGSGSLSSFSSEGPADDGRIKPDLTANGEGLKSTVGDSNGTSSKSGTSMATPNASGSSILLQDYFSKRFPGHLMRAVSLKNLILHTADDRGNTGPDYKYGWGYMNTYEAGKVIRAYADNPGNRRMIEGRLTSGAVHTYTFSVSGTTALKVNLAWEEPSGQYQSVNDDRTPRLINDLDLRVTDAASTEYLPWAMPFVLNGFDTADYGSPAVKADNTVDNVEQVLVNSPAPGVYTVTVSHKDTSLWDSYQKSSPRDEVAYSLIVSGVDDAGTAPAPAVTSISPDNGIFHHSELTVEGSGFLLGANVVLEAPGLPDIEAYAEMVSPGRIDCFLPLSVAEPGEYTVRVINPDGQEALAAAAYTVRNYVELLTEDFEDGFSFGSGAAAWVSGANEGPNDWSIQSSDALSGSADLHVSSGNDLTDSWVMSPEITLPATADPIRVRFVHEYDFPMNLTYSPQPAHGGVLEITTDGSTFDLIQERFTDTSVVSGPLFYFSRSSANPLPFANVWGDNSRGRVYTDVRIDPSEYGGQTVRFRWRMGAMLDGGTGYWRIDDIEVAAASTNAPPQFTAVPPVEAEVDSLYSFTLEAVDPDAGDPLTFSGVTLPSWLSLTDHGDGTATLSGTPTAVGNEPVLVSVTDGEAVRDLSFMLVVTPLGGNTPPAFLTASQLPTVNVGDLIAQPIAFEDADGHEVEISLVGTLPSWLTFGLAFAGDGGGPTGYQIAGTPPAYAVGTHRFTLRLSDGLDVTDREFEIEVRPLAQIAFASATASVAEDAGSVTVQVQRSLNTVGAVSVQVATSNGSATAGADYSSHAETLNWADGDGDSKSVTVTLLDDLSTEGNETFEIRLSNPSSGAELGGTATAVVTIQDNENNVAPLVSIDSPAIPFAGVAGTGIGLVLDATVTDDGQPLDPGTVTRVWSVEAGPAGAVIADDSAEDTTVTFASEGIYTLRLTADDGEFSTSAEVKVKVGGDALIVAGTGLLWQRFDGISGTGIADLTGAAAYPDAPDVEEVITTGFQVPSDQGANFGQRVRGYFVAPQTGEYTFYIASDDSSQLWLSTDANPANSVQIASVDGNTGGSEWDKYPSQQSAPIALQAGENYYIEALHKEGSGDDHLTVRVVLPDATDLSPVPVTYLAVLTPTPPNYGPEPLLPEPAGAQAGIEFPAGGSVSDDGTPGTGVTTLYQGLSGPGTLAFTDASALATTATASAPGTYSMRLVADDGQVRTFVDRSFSVDPGGPAVLLNPPGATATVAEGGAGDNYTLVLNTAPASDVTVSLNPDSQVEVSPSSRTFTTSNWDQPQTVTVTAVDDTAEEGVHSGIVSHSVSSTDGDYDGITVPDLTVSISDNDVNFAPQVVIDTPVPDALWIPEGVGLRLEATATDEGLPDPPGALSFQWSDTGSTGNVQFEDATAEDTTAHFSAPGTYVLQLDVSDSVLSAQDQVTVTVGGAVAPADALVYYPMDEAQGSAVAADASGNGRDAAAPGGSFNAAAGQVGGGASFSGAGGQHLEDADGEVYLNGLSAITVAVWVQSDIVGTDRGWVVGEQPDSSGGQQSIRYDSQGWFRQQTGQAAGNNVIQGALSTAAGIVGIESSENIQTTGWQHVVLTWSSGSRPRLYINGVEDTPSFWGTQVGGTVTQGDLITSTITDSTTLIVGASIKDQNSSWDGRLDEFRLYGRALSALEVASVYQDAAGALPQGALVEAGDRFTAQADVASALSGSADDGAVLLWERVSGPGTVQFSDASSATSDVTFSAGGTQVLRLIATVNGITTTDEVTVTVEGGIVDDNNNDVPDDWEAIHEDPENPGMVKLQDGNSYPIRDVYFWGVDSMQGGPLRTENPAVNDAGGFTFTFYGVNGVTYRVMCNTDIRDDQGWTLVEEYGSVPGSGATVTVTDPDPPSTCVYRVEVVMP